MVPVMTFDRRTLRRITDVDAARAHLGQALDRRFDLLAATSISRHFVDDDHDEGQRLRSISSFLEGRPAVSGSIPVCTLRTRAVPLRAASISFRCSRDVGTPWRSSRDSGLPSRARPTSRHDGLARLGDDGVRKNADVL